MEPSSSSSSSSSSMGSFSLDSGKLFVGGISDGIREEEIRDYFNKYGEVKEVAVVKDRGTGNVRGFGFVLFSDPDSAERALKEKGQHVIGDRTVEVKRARPRGEQRRNYQSPQHHYPILSQHENRGPSNSDANNKCNNENLTRSKKIFVGGLSSSVTEDEFKSYFEKFGRITDVVIMYDSATHRPRGFGFITFDSEEAVENVMKKNFHELNNKFVEVKIAVPKDGNNQNIFSNHNGSNYSSSMGGGRGSVFSNHQGGIYPPYSPRYGLYPGYAPPPVSGFFYGTAGYGGGYTIGPYGGIGYGAPYVSPRSPWNGQGLVAARRSPGPYGNASMYPNYLNAGFGGYTGMSGGYRGMVWSGNGKLNQTGADVRITEDTTRTADVGSVKLDAQQTS